MLPTQPDSSLPRGHIRQRLFAYMTAHSGDNYENTIAPRKQALLGNLHGAVLEIGPGTGPNLRYYPSDVRWTGVEPNPFMYPHLLQALQALDWTQDRYKIVSGDLHSSRLPVDDESVDAVVGTLVLCSVTNPDESLREIIRVLKPGGKFVFIEHVAAQRRTGLRTIQNLIQPVWSFAGGGCHPNRETWETISRAGFAQVSLEHFHFPEGGLAGPHIAGIAIKSG